MQNHIIDKRTVVKNVVTTIAQIIFNGLVYYWLYKFMILHLGVEQLGVMSLVLAITSVASISNLGLTSSIVQFAATYLAKGDVEKIDALIKTSAIFLCLFFSLFSIIVYAAVSFFIDSIVQNAYKAIVLKILPYSLLSLLVLTLSGVFTSLLEGVQKNFLKNYTYIISSIIFVAIVWWWLPSIGLIAVAIAQVLQSSCILLLSVFFCKKEIKSINLLSWKWNKSVFKEIFSYGIKYQFISIASMLFEPITKFFIGKFSSLSLLGYYEMASRMVTQVRGLVVNANQVLIPVNVHVNENYKEQSSSLFYKVFNINFIVTIFIMSCLLSVAPIISLLWIGNLNINFLIMTTILVVAYSFNSFTAPVYFAKLAEANLHLLLKAHILMGLINLGLGYCMGKLFTGMGSVLAWAIALIIPSFYLIDGYMKEKQLNITDMVSKRDVIWASGIFIFSIAATLVYVLSDIKKTTYGSLGLMVGLLLFIVGITYYYKNLWVKNIVAKLNSKKI
jgi:O-antigen/teichoic acid export membrane protein